MAIVDERPRRGGRGRRVPVARRQAARAALRAGHGPDRSSRRSPATGRRRLSVAAPCRFVVLPDFFADDIVVDAAEIPVATAELPSENFLLHLLPDRDAIVMTVASNREQDARIDRSPARARERLIDRSEMYYGTSGKIWVAVLAGPRHLARPRRGQGARPARSSAWTGPRRFPPSGASIGGWPTG